MANDDILTEAIRLIKAGNREAARSVLEPFLFKNPNHIQAWMWEAELFPNDRDKIRVLEACLKHNPDHPQVTQALTFLKKRSVSNKQPTAPVPQVSAAKPTPSTPAFFMPPAAKPAPATSPFSISPFLPDPVVPASVPQQTAVDSPPVETEHPQPSLPKNARPQKKSKRMTPVMKNVLIFVMACIVLIAIIGSYLGGGFYLNGQINKAFIEQNCADVVQHTTFVLVYPRGVFAPVFTGHDQYTECRIKLDVEQAVAAKNWEEASSRAQEYLAAYPNGSFAGSMSEQVPKILSTWSGELIAGHDYGGGIEKLKQLVESYPASPLAQPAPDAILQAYLLWVKELTGKQNYADAEQNLNKALAYFQADSVRLEQIKQQLVKLYVDWGDMQIQLRDVDNGIKHYKMAGGIIPGKTDVDLLIARAYLQQAMDIADTRNFDGALEKIKAISDAAQAENIKSEANAAQEKILAAYSVSTSPQAMDQLTAAIPLVCQGQRPKLPIFGLDAEKVRFGLISFYVKLPVELTAEKPSELHYVICISEAEEEIETCGYTDGFSLVRMRYVWQITLYDVVSGSVHDSKTFKGPSPDACPSQANFRLTSKVSRSYGRRPTMEEIVTWLDGLNIVK